MNDDSTVSPPRLVFVRVAATTVLVSAFLLFQVQPLISRTILPWFGGSPAVWSTCMLFFQLLLLAGYGYAHALSRLSPKVQAAVHGALLVGAVVTLPITVDPSWKPPDSLRPVPRILLLLLAHVGLPYFLLSSTGPLVQAWYARVIPRSPYRLYALSNLGSLAALVTYPLLVEPRFGTRTQALIWSGGFVLFAVLCAELSWRMARSPAHSRAATGGEVKEISVIRLAVWLLLPALASVMLLAVTARICQDVAVSPLMWVAPLSLYLLTFIICFDREAWYLRLRLPVAVLAAISVLAVANVMLADEIHSMYAKWGVDLPIAHLDNDVVAEAAVALTMLWFVCLVCHGELVRLKPPPAALTAFYLMVAAGGALGGVIVGVLCPLLLNFTAEWSVSLLAGFLLSSGVAIAALRTRMGEEFRAWHAAAGAVLIVAGVMVTAWAQLNELSTTGVARQRSFYGVLQVRQYNVGLEDEGRGLYNGRILHGYQYWTPEQRSTPTTYYTEDSGVGVALRLLAEDGPRRVGVIGLGAGTLAAYGQAGDQYRFYEINPQAIDFAKTYFTFLKDSPAEVATVLGDGRIALENEPPQRFDALVLDAFTGDSIPVHLLTAEAMEVYLRHLDQQGVICVHISNRHLDLRPVCAALARRFDLRSLEVHSSDAAGLAITASNWVLLTRDREFLDQVTEEADAKPLAAEPLLWTDAYSNLLQIMK